MSDIDGYMDEAMCANAGHEDGEPDHSLAKQPCPECERLSKRVEELERALRMVWKWDLPKVPDSDGDLMPYHVMFGSNGERDYVRNLARTVLEGSNDD